MNKRTKLWIAALCCILFTVSVAACGKKKENTDNESSAAQNTDTVTEQKSYDILGSWYSDRENGDMLTLKEDGSYTSSVWLKDGIYTISGDMLILKDTFGKETRLSIVQNKDEITLIYSEKASGHTYYRTEDKLNEAKAVQESSAAEEQNFNETILMKILTTGDWKNQKSFTEPGGYTLHITDTEFLVSANEEHEMRKDPKFTELFPAKAYKYKITEIRQEEVLLGSSAESRYSFKATITRDNGDIQENVPFTVEIGNDNFYSISSGGFPYNSKTYSKTIKIDFDMKPTEAPEEIAALEESETLPEPPIIAHIYPETDSSKERTIIHEDGSVEHIRQIRRNDNPDLSSLWEDKVKRTNETVIGSSWRGTFDDTPIENTVYWTFDLNADNTYSRFNGETGVSETGTYTISYEETGTAYYGIFHLTNTEDVQTDLPFYLSTSQITQEPQLNLEMEPTYFLQK
jgi:hypothetical protein